jgi:transposase
MSKKRFELLTVVLWELIWPLLPEPKRRKDNLGCPWASNRACLEGILWVLQTGIVWRLLPDKYPSPATYWRRLKQWEEQDV